MEGDNPSVRPIRRLQIKKDLRRRADIGVSSAVWDGGGAVASDLAAGMGGKRKLALIWKRHYVVSAKNGLIQAALIESRALVRLRLTDVLAAHGPV